VFRVRLTIVGATLCSATIAAGVHPLSVAASPHGRRQSTRRGATRGAPDKKPSSSSRRAVCVAEVVHHKPAKAGKACSLGKPKLHAGPKSNAGLGEAPVGSPPVESGPVESPPMESEPAESESPTVDLSAPRRFFSPTSFWNEPVPADEPLDPSSAAVVTALDEQVAAEEDDEKGPAINTTKWSVPIYTVPANQPMVKVTLENPTPPLALQSAWDAVPLPSDAQPAAGSDGHLVVWQPSTDRLWEFWRLLHGPEGWAATWGGAMQNASSDPGAYGPEAWPGAKPAWGASASSLSIAGGLITLEDLEKGRINHALAIGIPDVRAGVYASPAERTDGTSTDPLSLPEGARLRLNPTLNLAALHLPRLTLMMAKAAQRYGILVRDTAGNVAFYAQDPISTGTEPYNGPGGYFEGESPQQLLAVFPWSQLQLLKMQLHSVS
jgi:hypothetical protein